MPQHDAGSTSVHSAIGRCERTDYLSGPCRVAGRAGRRVAIEHAHHAFDAVVLGIGQAGVATIDARARSIDEVRDACVPAGLENVREADEVAVDVGLRVGQRVAHAGLGREVNDLVEALTGEQVGDGPPVRDVHRLEAKLRARAEPREPDVLESGIVVVVQVVQAHDVVAAREQRLRGMHADEARRTGHQDFQTTRPGIVIRPLSSPAQPRP